MPVEKYLDVKEIVIFFYNGVILRMNSLYNYFDNEENPTALLMNLHPCSITITQVDTGQEEIFEVPIKAKYKVAHRIIQLSFYIKKVGKVVNLIQCLLENIESVKEEAYKIKISVPDRSEFTLGDNPWSVGNHFYFYTEDILSNQDLNLLNEYCKGKTFTIQIKTMEYAVFKNLQQKNYAFICHDSRDKKLIAKPLANALNSRLCPVWYDEYSLKIGANLTESIDKGIKSAEKCIVILTKNFFKNPGWTKREFRMIMAKQMIKGDNVIIPIWYGVTKQEIYDYCGELYETFAVIWPSPRGKKAEKYQEQVHLAIDKIYNHLKAPQNH